MEPSKKRKKVCNQTESSASTDVRKANKRGVGCSRSPLSDITNGKIFIFINYSVDLRTFSVYRKLIAYVAYSFVFK